MQKAVIIVAGGSGQRMGAPGPKQFIEIAGKPILMHTLEAFYRWDAGIEIILVLPESQKTTWENLKKTYSFNLPHKIAFGGKERFHSVKNGLGLLSPEVRLVGIHDGVRPFPSKETITACFEKAAEYGAAIPVINVNDSLRKAEGENSVAVNRDAYKLVQTPQCFKKEILAKAYEQQYQAHFTDDASVVEALGYSIQLTEGNPENIKITRPVDLAIAEALMDKTAF
jgi:2-C-methyl-D-erythritol 4-phosphate cytidylyltransferase